MDGGCIMETERVNKRQAGLGETAEHFSKCTCAVAFCNGNEGSCTAVENAPSIWVGH